MLLAHFAIRGLMHEAALTVDEDPDRVSFVHAVRVVRRTLPRPVALPPQDHAACHEALLTAILDERVVSSRQRRTSRGLQRQLSHSPLRPRHPWPTHRRVFTVAVAKLFK